jgi:hypothetical protein
MIKKSSAMILIGLIAVLSGCIAQPGPSVDLFGGDTGTPPPPQYYLNAVIMGKIIQSKYMIDDGGMIISGRYSPYTKIEKVDVRGYEDVDVPLWIGPTLRQVYGLNKFVVADITGKYQGAGSNTTDIRSKAWILEFGSNSQAANAFNTIDLIDVALLAHVDSKRELKFSAAAANALSSSMNPASGQEEDIRQRFIASSTLRDTDIPYLRRELMDTYKVLKDAYNMDTSKTTTTEIPGSTLDYNLINNFYLVSFTQQNLVVIVIGFVDTEQAEKPIVGTAGRIYDLLNQQVLIYNAVGGQTSNQTS